MAFRYKTFQLNLAMGINESDKTFYLNNPEFGKLVAWRIWTANLNAIGPLPTHKGVIVQIQNAGISGFTEGAKLAGNPIFIDQLVLGITAATYDTVAMQKYYAVEVAKERSWVVARAPIWPRQAAVNITKQNDNQTEDFGMEYTLRVEVVDELATVQAMYGQPTT